MKMRNLVHLELFRILAIYWVLFNHTNNMGFFLFSIAKESVFYWLYLFMSIACKFAVPLFFMISGALLLNKEESIITLYKKRVLKMIIILFAISFFYQIYNTGIDFKLSSFFIKLYSSRLHGALYYLYIYIALLTMLPILRKAVRNLICREYIYLAGMSILLVGIIPILQYRIGLDKVVINPIIKGALFTSTPIVFFLMGYFFEHVLPEEYFTWKNAYIGIITSIICIGICCYMTDFRATIMGKCAENISQVFHNSLIAIPTYTVYFTGKLLFMKRKFSPKIQTAICLVGSTTFGIFLFERVFREKTRIVFTILEPIITTMPACLVWILVAFIVGGVTTIILKKIPLIREYI